MGWGLQAASTREGEISSWKGVIVYGVSAGMLCSSAVQEPHTKSITPCTLVSLEAQRGLLFFQFIPFGTQTPLSFNLTRISSPLVLPDFTISLSLLFSLPSFPSSDVMLSLCDHSLTYTLHSPAPFSLCFASLAKSYL